MYIDTTFSSEFKTTTTLFIVPEADSTLKAGYEHAISSTWKYTPYKIITVNELEQYVHQPGYSFFCERYMGKSSNGNAMANIYTGPYNGVSGLAGAIGIALAEGIIEKSIDHQDGHEYIGQSREGELFGVPPGINSVYSFFIPDKSKNGMEICKQKADIKIGVAGGHELYEDVVRKNVNPGDAVGLISDPYWNPYWNPGLLKLYLQMINCTLTTGTGRRQYSNFQDPVSLPQLTTDTLYIPDYIVPYLLISANQEDSSRLDSVITACYPYPYRIITSRQLSDKLLNAVRPFNFITYGTYNNLDIGFDLSNHYNEHKKYKPAYKDRGIKVYNSEKGNIYACFPRKHYLIEPKESVRTSFNIEDLRDLAEAVKGEGR